jgi:hypothetical protein
MFEAFIASKGTKFFDGNTSVQESVHNNTVNLQTRNLFHFFCMDDCLRRLIDNEVFSIYSLC